MNLAFILQAVLAISFVISVLNLSNDIMKNHKGELYGASASKWIKCLGIGALCNFMDTLGIGSLKPGAGVGKDLISVGDVFITGIVNLSGLLDRMLLQTTRLHTVMSLADRIYLGIRYGLNLFAEQSSSANRRMASLSTLQTSRSYV